MGTAYIDPTYEIQIELERSLTIAQSLSERLTATGLSSQEVQWTENELKKSIRAIYWAVDDYSHTLSVLALDPFRTPISGEDRQLRSQFVHSAREFADDIRRNVLGIPDQNYCQDTVKVHNAPSMSGSGAYKYSLLNNDDEFDAPSASGSNENSGRFEDILLKQERIIQDQDDDLELVGNSVKTLKHMSYRIGDELDQQSIMLDDLGNDMDRVDSKLDGVMKKIAKLSNLDDDKKQCKVIIILSALLFFLIFLLIVL